MTSRFGIGRPHKSSISQYLIGQILRVAPLAVRRDPAAIFLAYAKLFVRESQRSFYRKVMLVLLITVGHKASRRWEHIVGPKPLTTAI